MANAITTQAPTYMETLEPIVVNVIEPAAADIDQSGVFPKAALDALARAGLLGLISAREVGGLGQGHRAATMVMDEFLGPAPRPRWSCVCTTPLRR